MDEADCFLPFHRIFLPNLLCCQVDDGKVDEADSFLPFHRIFLPILLCCQDDEGKVDDGKSCDSSSQGPMGNC